MPHNNVDRQRDATNSPRPQVRAPTNPSNTSHERKVHPLLYVVLFLAMAMLLGPYFGFHLFSAPPLELDLEATHIHQPDRAVRSPSNSVSPKLPRDDLRDLLGE